MILLVLLVSLFSVLEAVKTYKQGAALPVYSNKIGPYHNPSITYRYSKFSAFCQPTSPKDKDQHFGEKLEGDTKEEFDQVHLAFATPSKRAAMCERELTAEQIDELIDFIEKRFYYEFVVEDIPVHGFIGFSSPDRKEYYLFTHYQFYLFANLQEGSLIFANITNDPKTAVKLTAGKGKKIDFTYTANWFSVTIPSSERHAHFDLFFNRPPENQVHWLSIFNSIGLVLLLLGIVASILYRILTNDYQRYDPENLGQKPEDEYGWKIVHTDVFRFPPYINLLSAMVGVGVQFLSLTVSILGLSAFGIYYPGNDGALIVSGIVCYALTAGIAGFVSAYWFKKFEGVEWVRNIFYVSGLFALPFLGVTGVVNAVGLSSGVTKALPFGTILSVLAIWGLLGLPLTLFGGIAGKRVAGPFKPPSKPKMAVRELPEIPIWASLPSKMALAGFLAFSAIYIEVHYMFNSLWGRASFDLWGILTIVFVLLILTTACSSISLTYLQLSMEDYRWWWPSFLLGGSTGFWVFGYSVFFFLYRSSMSGSLQATYFFGYQLLICYFFFLMLGSVAFLSALVFVRRIYTNLHTD